MPEPALHAPEPLRVVLFGPPGAGKSSLLGALSHAAEVQPHLLAGRIVDASPNLAELRRQVYEYDPPAAAADPVSYSFHYESDGAAGRRAAVVLDCDGRPADALVRDAHPADGRLAQEILHADAVVLAVDAAAAPEQLDAVFGEFDGFLRRMEQERGERTDVGGLPVFLVLTKCDRLARPGEITADWLERIEERKREIAARFHNFLAARDTSNAQPAFGRIHLHLWATAVRRPTLAGATARPTDPYGVAELFRQCLRHATAYHAQRERSAHRLIQMTLAGAGAIVLLLVAAASMVLADVLHPPPSDLEVRVANLRSGDSSQVEDRLRGSPERLQADLDVWTRMHDAPNFGALPPDLRDYVEGRISELNAYIPWLEKLEEATPPHDAVSEEELRTVRDDLAEMKPPRPGWEATDAGRLWADLSAEAKTLILATEDLQRWYNGAYDVGDALWAFTGYDAGGRPDWNGWARDARNLLDPLSREPAAVNPTDVALLWAAGLRGPGIPGAACPWAGVALGPGVLRRFFVPGVDPPMTQAALADFGSVASARERWEAVRGRVGRLRDVGAALGFIKGLPGKPDLLVLPTDVPTLDQAAALFRQVREAYPDYQAAFMGGDPLPVAVAPAVREEAARNYRAVLGPARDEVLSELQQARSGDPNKSDAETRERWKQVSDWLKDPKELGRGPQDPLGPDGWRGLGYSLARLADPDAPDPVFVLAAFLDTDSFTIRVSDFTLVVPDALDVEPAAGRPLEVHLVPTDPKRAPTVIVFRPVGMKERVGTQPYLKYSYEADDPDGKVVYAPGDELYAELPLAGGKKLRWDRSRSRLYQFDALREEPVLLDADRPGQRLAAKGVRLHPQPDSGTPKVPDLMPQVDLK